MRGGRMGGSDKGNKLIFAARPFVPSVKRLLCCSSHIVIWYLSTCAPLGKASKKNGKKRSGWPLGLTTPPPPKWSGKCENFRLWLSTLDSDYIQLETNFTPKKSFLTTDPPRSISRHFMISTVLAVLGQNIHSKCIFQPFHNEVKSVLGINESYPMGKKS